MFSNSRNLFSALFGAVLLASACQCQPDSVSEAPSDAGPPAPVRTALARLASTKGGVQLEREGQRRPATPESLFARDVLETASDGEAHVHFPDGRSIEIGPEARVEFGEDAEGVVLDVKRGLVLSRTSAKPAAGAAGSGREVSIRILTPFGLTRIGGGPSEVAIAVGEDGAKIDVTVGTIQLLSRDGTVREEAGAGDSLSFTQGEIKILARKGEPLMLDPIVVVLKEENGRAELRKKGERRWTQIARAGAPLSQGDAVRVASGRSRMNLEGSDSAVTLERGAEMVFETSGRAMNLEESRLDLKRGGLGLKLASGKRSRVVVGGAILEAEQGGFFTVQKTRDGLAVSSRVGDLVLRRGEKGDQKISAGEVARLRGDAVNVEAEALPDLVLPSRGGQRVYHPGVDRALITWRGETADYRIRVAEDARFEQLLLEGIVHAPRVAVDVPRRGTLFWEVQDAAGAKVDSGSAVLGPEPALKDLERLRNEVADGAEKTTIFYQDKPPAVTFTVAAEEGAANYKVAVFRSNALDAPIAERTVPQTRIPLEAGVLAEGSYLWSATPLSAAGEPLRGGRMNKLDLVYDNSVPTLVIRGPANGAKVGRSVRTWGVAPVGSRLYVNGRSVELDEKNRFDAEVTPEGRLIVYRLVRPGAADALYVRTVRRSGR